MQKMPSGTEYLDPQAILRRAGLGLGMVVADFGCGGAGYFTLQAARDVGEKGKVWAADVFKPALSSLMGKVRLAGLRNVEAVWTNLEIMGAAKQITSNSVDLGLLHNVLHQTKNHLAILKECSRTLKQKGKLLIIDWRVGDYYFGPPRAHLVSADDTVQAGQALGFRLVERFEPGRYHWAAVLEKT